MPVSIKDIAKEANVSPSTVSRALNGHPRISAETKTYVQDLARDMGYVPSVVARTLVAGRSTAIGVAISDVLDLFYIGLMSSIEDAIINTDYQVFVSSFYRDQVRELALANTFHERRFAGIIVGGSLVDETYLTLPSRSFMPVVLVNCFTYPFSVAVNQSLGAYKAIEHLIKLGHRRIAYVAQGLNSSAESQRLNSYRTVLNEHHIPLDEALIVKGDGGISGGMKAVSQLLDLPQLPTAIFCFNDMTAIGVINALREKSYEVPRDISVVGFDDLEISAYYQPALTTVRQPIYRIGKSAVNMLLRLIGGDNDVVPEIIDPELVIRRSTAPITN
jgi:DNA-binding LacI/PurR family transcriptional regulator